MDILPHHTPLPASPLFLPAVPEKAALFTPFTISQFTKYICQSSFFLSTKAILFVKFRRSEVPVDSEVHSVYIKQNTLAMPLGPR